MTRKNWGLLIILLLLSGVFVLLLNRQQITSSLQVEEDLFAVADTASVQRIELQQPGNNLQVLERQGNTWRLNDTYQADDRLVRLLLNVLQDVEVKRPVATNQQAEVQEELQQNGTQVRVYDQSGLLQDFYAGGLEGQQISWFMQEGRAYVVELPGYVSYISGIFTLDENNLRNKTLFSTNFLNLQSIEVAYPNQAAVPVQIDFDGEQIQVAGIAQPDSSRLLNFLSLFENLQAVGFVNPQEYPELDSLLQQQPVAEITVRSLQYPEGKRLQLYPATPDQRFRLSWLPDEQQAALIDERLARELLLRREQLMNSEE